MPAHPPPAANSITTSAGTNGSSNSTSSNTRTAQPDAESPASASGVTGPGSHKRGPSDLAHSPAESNGTSSSQPLAEDQSTKKRRTGPGSRGVANLTPEQLAKKRANDREAQRAIRERTKNQIENLEKRILELTSQQPYQELQAVIRAKEAVEAELADVKGRMASIMALIQPILAGGQQASYASPVLTFTTGQSAPPPPDPPGHNAASTPPSTASPSSVDRAWQQSSGVHSAGSSTQTSPNFNQAKMISLQRQDSIHALDLGPAGEQLKLDFLLDQTSSERINRMQTGANGAQDLPSYNHMPMKHDLSGFPISSPHPGCLATEAVPVARHNSESWGSYSAPIKNCTPTCPLDSLLLEFLSERRQRAAEGVPNQEIVGPRYPSVSSLLNPSQSVYAHPLSKVFTDILATFPGICTLPERVAVLYIMFLLMRWQISPTKENYDRLPAWVTPTPAQLLNPHPAWCDSIPFPRMRDLVVKEYQHNNQFHPTTVPFENFFIPFTNTLSLNWPYEQTDTLLESPDGVELIINPVFERHLRRLENWTLGEAFHQTFPQLEGTYNLKREVGVRGIGDAGNSDGAR